MKTYFESEKIRVNILVLVGITISIAVKAFLTFTLNIEQEVFTKCFFFSILHYFLFDICP